MQLLFAFTFNPETKEATVAGNMSSAQALQILQHLVIAEAVQQAQNAKSNSNQDSAEKEKVSESIQNAVE